MAVSPLCREDSLPSSEPERLMAARDRRPLRARRYPALRDMVLPVLVACGGVGGMGVPAERLEARQPPAVIRQLVGGGQWESRRDGRGRRDWQVELKRRDDGSVGGRVTVVGSRVLHEARIEGDRQIGTFTGYRAARSLSGTYTFANGDTGTWTWRGAVPE